MDSMRSSRQKRRLRRSCILPATRNAINPPSGLSHLSLGDFRARGLGGSLSDGSRVPWKLVDEQSHSTKPPCHFFVDRWGYYKSSTGQAGRYPRTADGFHCFAAPRPGSTEKGPCALHLPVLSKNQKMEPYPLPPREGREDEHWGLQSDSTGVGQHIGTKEHPQRRTCHRDQGKRGSLALLPTSAVAKLISGERIDVGEHYMLVMRTSQASFHVSRAFYPLSQGASSAFLPTSGLSLSHQSSKTKSVCSWERDHSKKEVVDMDELVNPFVPAPNCATANVTIDTVATAHDRHLMIVAMSPFHPFGKATIVCL